MSTRLYTVTVPVAKTLLFEQLLFAQGVNYVRGTTVDGVATYTITIAPKKNPPRFDPAFDPVNGWKKFGGTIVKEQVLCSENGNLNQTEGRKLPPGKKRH